MVHLFFLAEGTRTELADLESSFKHAKDSKRVRGQLREIRIYEMATGEEYLEDFLDFLHDFANLSRKLKIPGIAWRVLNQFVHFDPLEINLAQRREQPVARIKVLGTVPDDRYGEVADYDRTDVHEIPEGKQKGDEIL